MTIDYGLVLAAGRGTRMGEVGEKLPKVLWPIFERPMIQLVKSYALELGAKEVYTNLYHEKELISSELISHAVFNKGNIIFEDKKIDVGGAIHNFLDKVSKRGVLLVANSDQFAFFDWSLLTDALAKLKDYDHLLFTRSVNSSDGYNALDIDAQKCFRGVIQNQNLERNKKVETYTGLSLINLSKLKALQGESQFFDTVITERSKTYTYNIDGGEYWDFGTTQRYVTSMFKTLNEPNSRMFKFLHDMKAIKPELIQNGSYNSSATNEINLEWKKMKVRKNEVTFQGLKSKLLKE